MPSYKAPIRDMQFVMYELLNVEEHYQQLLGSDDVNKDLVNQILGWRRWARIALIWG